MVYKFFDKNFSDCDVTRARSEALFTRDKSDMKGMSHQRPLKLAMQLLAEEIQSQLLENLNNKKYTHLLKIIIGVLTLWICN